MLSTNRPHEIETEIESFLDHFRQTYSLVDSDSWLVAESPVSTQSPFDTHDTEDIGEGKPPDCLTTGATEAPGGLSILWSSISSESTGESHIDYTIKRRVARARKRVPQPQNTDYNRQSSSDFPQSLSDAHDSVSDARDSISDAPVLFDVPSASEDASVSEDFPALLPCGGF